MRTLRSSSIPMLVCLAAFGAACAEPNAIGSGGGQGGTSGDPADGSDSDGGDGPGGFAPGDAGSSSGGGEGDGDGSSGGAEPTVDPAGCSRSDLPDVAGMDTDGDGIDGALCGSVFVDPSQAMPGNDGLTPSSPVATIARGIEIAALFDPPRDVLVVGDTFEETVIAVAGVDLYGSYTPGFGGRDFGHLTRVVGVDGYAFVARGIDQDLRVQGFSIEGRDATVAGDSGFAVLIAHTQASSVLFEAGRIVAGRAAAGLAGVDGSPGAIGGDGRPGGDFGLGGTSACGVTGGAGGSALTCPGSDATAGFAMQVTAVGGTPGVGGLGDCEALSCDDVPSDGLPGQRGNFGTSGKGAEAAMLSGHLAYDGTWIAVPTPAASDGGHGGGGGGGGAAGYDVDGNACAVPSVSDGGIAGGGGAGGCGGTAGGSGRPGGSSFAVVAIDAIATLHDVVVIGGEAGDGGAGGDGAKGGAAGTGGAALVGGGPQAASPGRGGDGGPGGGGGGGAGGCGGHSAAIVTRSGASVLQIGGNVVLGTAGVGGPGGAGGLRGDGVVAAPSGADGCDGVQVDRLEL